MRNYRIQVKLLAAYFNSDAATKRAGREWYDNARQVCQDIADAAQLPLPGVIGALAALSPRMPWARNVALTALLCEAYAQGKEIDLPCLKNSCENALAALKRNSFEHFRPTASKVAAFARATAGDTDAVALDAHMLRVMGIETQPTPKQYASYARLVTECAKIVGETPRDFQAIVWCRARGSAE